MYKLLQINCVSNVLSTGKIAEDIGNIAIANGWDSYIAYGRFAKKSSSHEIRIGKNIDVYHHYIMNLLFDNEGLESKKSTIALIKEIEIIKPDIIQLHNIHDHYLNYPILFKFLSRYNCPVIWVQHDCWAFTGGCCYFDMTGCESWKRDCRGCKHKRSIFGSKSEYHFKIKKDLLSQINNLTYVTVSDWIAGLLKESSQSDRNIITIHNGIDVQLFKPSTNPKHNIDVFRIIGVAAVWDERKGLDDFLMLREKLSSDYEIVLVGLTIKQIKKLPNGIIGITRTTNIQELVDLYSSSDVFVNPTYSDNFPTTNLEALACGIPVITYRTGGSPEAIDEKTGIVVEQGDINGLVDAILTLRQAPLTSEDCRNRALNMFDKNKCFAKYIDLYNRLINKNNICDVSI